MSGKPVGTLVDQREALSLYFEALLREEPPPPPVVTAVVQPPPATAASAPAPAATAGVKPSAHAPTAPVATDVPAWGSSPFQAMLFKVGGLTLAVPLAELNGIQEWEASRVTPMPGHAAWYLGLVPYRGRNVPVVDTARLVLPEDRLAKLTTPAEERVSRIVFIGEGRWGLGCDEVSEVVTLKPDQVRWRTERTKRKWLAGTVIEHMCALLEPSAFAEMLAAGISPRLDRNR